MFDFKKRTALNQPNKESIEQALLSLSGLTKLKPDENPIAWLREAIKSIYSEGSQEIAESLDCNAALILTVARLLNATDEKESIYIASFIIGLTLGTYKLSHPHTEDRKIGINILRSGGDALHKLCDKRLSDLNTKEEEWS